MLVEAGEMGRLLDSGNGGRKVLAAVCSGLGRERRRRSGEVLIFVNIVKHAAVLIRFDLSYRLESVLFAFPFCILKITWISKIT